MSPPLEGRELELYLRDLFLSSVTADLLGPAGGPSEEVRSSPRSRYLVGRLVPGMISDPAAGSAPEAASQVVDANPDDEPDGDEQPTLLAEQDPALEVGGEGVDADPAEDAVDTSSLASKGEQRSMGLSFQLPEDVLELEVLLCWGSYARTDAQNPDLAGATKKVWKRQDHAVPLTLQLSSPDQELSFERKPDPDSPGIVLRGKLRKARGGRRTVSLFLVNAAVCRESEQLKEAKWIFQPQMTVYHPSGQPVFLDMSQFAQGLDAEAQQLAFLYRNEGYFGMGYGCAVSWVGDPEVGATKLIATPLPMVEIPVTEVPGSREGDRPAQRRWQQERRFGMQRLAALPLPELSFQLSELVSDYRAWIAGLESSARGNDSAEQSLAACREVADRLEEGVRSLQDPRTLKAFRVANLAMAEARAHQLAAQAQRRGETPGPSGAEQHAWRPFQLAFMLLNLPALADPLHRDRCGPDPRADLLWFPTGGGKTEAYLGTAALAIVLRRLQGAVGGYDGSWGLSVIMRYTLRLLTVQQFQRAAALICALELLRRGDPELGTRPFTLGLWLGSKVTPNRLEDLKEQIGEVQAGKHPKALVQLTHCPWCGSRIAVDKQVKVEDGKRGRGRAVISCADPVCPFGSGDGLPVQVVDEEIYRRPPSLLIATVDKFAALARNPEVRTLFGGATRECPRHGLIHEGERDHDFHSAAPPLPEVKAQATLPLRPPDLIIQDEFHLISGPLGTIVGLYEVAVDQLCSWSYRGREIRPKVIASTATTRMAADQMRRIFDRSVRIFPSPGLDFRDNYFAVQRPSEVAPGRTYVGVLAPGRTKMAALIQIYTAILTAGQALLEHFGPYADPYLTLIGYFNSLRDLAAMRRLTEDDVAIRSRLVERRQDQAVGLARRFLNPEGVVELTSRVPSEDIPELLDRLEVGFNSAAAQKPRPLDVVLTTNMFSVGVDVSRLGVMVVCSQPKASSEYLQATSRIGRAKPGVVFVLYQYSRPRDFSHYQTFVPYHRTIYRYVEPQSVTPFSRRALDRGLSGVLVGLLRQRLASLNPDSGAAQIDDPELAAEVEKLVGALVARADRAGGSDRQALEMVARRLKDWKKQAAFPGRKLTYDNRTSELRGRAVALLEKPKNPWELFSALFSMRDVEGEVPLFLDDRPLDAAALPWRVSERSPRRGEA